MNSLCTSYAFLMLKELVSPNEMNQRRINFEDSLKIPGDKWSVIDCFKDLDFFIDFCLARRIVWLELHRNKRGGKRPEP